MSELIMQLSEVMRAEVKSLDSLANNAANLSTPGFRSERSALGSDFLRAVTAGQQPNAETRLSTKEGALQVTGQTTDLAIRGDGWFLLESADGLVLTRNGRFRLTTEGDLVDRTGAKVLTESGSVTGLKASFAVSADGVIRQDDAIVAKLHIVTITDVSQLQAIGDGKYRYRGELTNSKGAAVVQGAFESSNVDTAADMMQLMRTTRHIETLQRSMSAYDQVLNTGINQLGK